MADCIYLRKEFKDYLEHFLANHIRAERTKVEYRRNVAMLCNYLKKDFLDISEDDASSFLSYMAKRVSDGELTKETYNVRKACFNVIAQYIVDEHPEEGFENPFSWHMPYKVVEGIRVKAIPSLSDADKLLEESRENKMYYLIFSMVLRMALTSSEIISLKKDRIQLVDGGLCVVFTNANGSISRAIRVPEDVEELLLDYLKSWHSADDYLFHNKYKNPLTLRNLDTAVKKYATKAGVSFTLQELRTRTILDMTQSAKEQGKDLKTVGDYVGIKELRLSSFANASMSLGRETPATFTNIRLKKVGE